MLQSLLLTGLGGVLGIMGTLLASQWQARNAKQVRAEQYTREDRYRLATNRIDAYTAFYRAAGRARSAMATHAHPKEVECGLIGDNATERHASAVLEFVTRVSQHLEHFVPRQWADLMKAYIHAARFELTFAADRHMPGSVPLELAADHNEAGPRTV